MCTYHLPKMNVIIMYYTRMLIKHLYAQTHTKMTSAKKQKNRKEIEKKKENKTEALDGFLFDKERNVGIKVKELHISIQMMQR